MSPKNAQVPPNLGSKHALGMVPVRIGPCCVAPTAKELELYCHRWHIFASGSDGGRWALGSGIPRVNRGTPAAGSALAADIAKAGGQVQLYPVAMSGIPLNAVSYCCDSAGALSHPQKKQYK